jgi:hypothetical protein
MDAVGTQRRRVEEGEEKITQRRRVRREEQRKERKGTLTQRLQRGEIQAPGTCRCQFSVVCFQFKRNPRPRHRLRAWGNRFTVYSSEFRRRERA